MMQLEGEFTAIALNICIAHYNPFWDTEQKGERKQAKWSVLPIDSLLHFICSIHASTDSCNAVTVI